ncbi:DUF817 domain-containing protein [Parvularcula sp. LCG005]|uniref:DUF817 domain-containing protein n=1 Tax=Parvularcula sp. LCG005 TaxID=3078805 RepID=UPI0029430A03|nr:DUF817 domain-containing protein [Parvularcula sp. LCG005]WOI54148.1 DUF817 domain-containing protein [Parvularcula sp. LCG005]
MSDCTRVDAVLGRLLPPVETAATRFQPRWLVFALSEFIVFGIKQAWACLFGGLMVAGIIASALWWPADSPIARYDALFVYAIGIQLVFLLTGLERLAEGRVILVFHIVGTVMEVFKTGAGSWVYPEPSLLRVGDVPLFSGFMYAAVGSYIARVIRVFDLRFPGYPRRRWTIPLAVLIYVNFFTHHYVWDLRWLLFGYTIVLFWRTRAVYRVWRWHHEMPMLVGFSLVAFFIWLAENVGTITRTWVYPDQAETWTMVSPSKFGSWFLLMIISWVLVTLVHRPVRRLDDQHAGNPILPLGALPSRFNAER